MNFEESKKDFEKRLRECHKCTEPGCAAQVEIYETGNIIVDQVLLIEEVDYDESQQARIMLETGKHMIGQRINHGTYSVIETIRVCSNGHVVRSEMEITTF